MAWRVPLVSFKVVGPYCLYTIVYSSQVGTLTLRAAKAIAHWYLSTPCILLNRVILSHLPGTDRRELVDEANGSGSHHPRALGTGMHKGVKGMKGMNGMKEAKQPKKGIKEAKQPRKDKKADHTNIIQRGGEVHSRLDLDQFLLPENSAQQDLLIQAW
jgi:hypothetical protein